MDKTHKSPRGLTTDNNEYNLIDFMILQAIEKINTLKLCEVKVVNEDGTLDVKPLVLKTTADGDIIPAIIYKKFPILQAQGGNAAFQIEYKEGDIVICGFCDRDIEAVKRNGKKETAPTTPLITPLAAGIVLGAVLFEKAQVYIKVKDDGIFAVGDFSVDGNLSVTGDLKVNGNISADGDIVSDGKMEAGNGASGTFQNNGQGATPQTMTISKGIITNIS